MAVEFQSTLLQSLYDGTASGSHASDVKLTSFRTAGGADLTNEIEGLDKRIATFESVLIDSVSAVGKSTADYPYDREGLRREFLDEVTALLLRRNYGASGMMRSAFNELSAAAMLQHRGYDTTVLQKTATTGYGIFDSLVTNTGLNTDARLNLLNDDGKLIFKSYATLIEAVFAAGDQLGNNPSRAVQVVSAIQPVSADGVTYDQVAQVTGYDATTKLPTYNTFLLEATATNASVIKDGAGNAIVTPSPASSARRILLSPKVATAPTPPATEWEVVVDGTTFHLQPANGGMQVRTSQLLPAVAATPTAPLTLNLPGYENEFPEKRIVSTYSFVGPNGSKYLVGLGTDQNLYVTSLAAGRRDTVGTRANLNAMEYLLFYNEARVKILRAQLAFKEAIVREIQDDLKKANEALADLELQSGYITATDKDGQPTNQLSPESTKMNLFNATASVSGSPIFLLSGYDSYHGSTEWYSNRTALKNYIDRKSSEAQQATLDYQNVLNRFNNALEVMAKLQEKLDNLLKGQLRNYA